MYLMALGAAGQCQTFGMGFMTGEAGRFEAVRGVAGAAGNFRVFARELDQLLAYRSVTVETGINQLGTYGNFARRVGIGVA